jgi:spermidine synthase
MTNGGRCQDDQVLTLATSVSERGELALLRRADGSLELRVNGLFAMDSAETASERLLASASIEAVSEGAPRGGQCLSVLVGGLGLGFTVAALLEDIRVGRVLVAEIEPDLVRWHRCGIVPDPSPIDVARPLLGDSRLEVVVGDVRDLVAAQSTAAFDLVLLDVDNGPGFLLHESNAPLYRAPFLTACAGVIRPRGVVAIWSASEAQTLGDAMAAVFASVETHRVPVTLNGRHTHYHLYLGRTDAAGAGHAR